MQEDLVVVHRGMLLLLVCTFVFTPGVELFTLSFQITMSTTGHNRRISVMGHLRTITITCLYSSIPKWSPNFLRALLSFLPFIGSSSAAFEYIFSVVLALGLCGVGAILIINLI